MENLLLQSSFSTKDLCSKVKVDSYMENMSMVFDVDIEREAYPNLNAKMDTFLLEDLLLVDCQTIGQRFYRTKGKIAKDGIDHFLIQFFLGGGTSHLSGDITCTTGSMIVIDTSKPWKAYNPDFRTLTLIIPSRVLEKHSVYIHDLHGKIIHFSGNAYASLCSIMLKELRTQVNKLDYAQAAHMRSSLIELVCASLKSSASKRSEQSETLFADSIVIKKFIDQNISDPSLSVESILKRFGISRTKLYKIFPKELGGVSCYIQNKRLFAVYRTITCEHSRLNISLSEIAYQYGFANYSSFSRAFKAKFTFSPRDLVSSFELQKKENIERKRQAFSWHDWYKNL